MGSVDDVTLVREVEQRLGAELATKILGWIGGRTSEGFGDVYHVDDDGLDAVTFALDLSHQPGHLVAVEDIANVAVYVHAHGGSVSLRRLLSVDVVFEGGG